MHASPTHVALVCASPLHIGGVEAHLLALLRYADRRRYRFSLIGALSPSLTHEAEALGAAVYPWHPAGQFDRRALAALADVLRDRGADVVHAHMPRAGLLGGFAARHVGCPMVLTHHGPSYHYAGVRTNPLKRWLYQRMEGWVNRRLAARVIYVSHTTFAEARALGLLVADRTRVIGNGIDLQRFAAMPDAELRAHLATPDAAPVICFVGRLSPDKGVDVLLDAIHRLPAPRPIIWLVGDGPLRAELEAQAQALHLTECVRFLGFRDDVPALMQSSDLICLPSRSENMSVAILEAMAAGKPCVATPVGDNARVITHGENGWLVEPGDAAALADALAYLVPDAALRTALGQRAAETAQHYTVEQMVHRTCAVYDELHARHP